MSLADFTAALSPSAEFATAHTDAFGALFRLADRSGRGHVGLDDYLAFSHLISKPGSEYELAFRLLDTDRDGVVTLSQFKQLITAHTKASPSQAPLDWSSEWMKLQFASAKAKADTLTFDELSQLMGEYEQERLTQEFRFHDKKQTGYISKDALLSIVQNSLHHRMNPYIASRLADIATLYQGKVSLANLRATYNAIQKIDHVAAALESARIHNPDGISKPELETLVRAKASFTPMEVDIVYHLASSGSGPRPERLTLSALKRLFEEKWDEATGPAVTAAAPAAAEPHKQHLSPLMEVLKSAYNFTLGSIAGAVGATVVYPIDLVKTRMQNQRNQVGEVLYKNGIDCFQKVIRNEGFRGLYSGLTPQLVGVAPEKAIKLTVNDLARSKLRGSDGSLPLWAEILAGCMAGGSQVIFTNPLEIVKIRLQVAGEIAKNAIDGAALPKPSAVQIVRQLGLLGLYKGVLACMLRDVPFSGIYFAAYAHLKTDLFGEGVNGKKLSAGELLTAGAIAGMPAAYLVTPADVIKTRLQVAARKGETTYTGIMDAFYKIMREEGPKAFFKGGVARVLRSSPQFGVTLACYELLKSALPINFEQMTLPHIPAAGVTSSATTAAAHEEKKNMLRVIHNLPPTYYNGRAYFQK
ncbi:mitochondrial carrier domain-containing protein [Polychytrium aggregatum]|uniref:mitochondrial carrier domain-containing protein n=1 Tax=Polychytrium aggregatum TaxID=110093 RepID=UPI0022FF14F0|nr:mitochondrial carrier domain-containing protein [Polychytrium aggregatum]KAI9204140.1 mitochondrial carrier domain-containing protein [Polychytrium aggregatum]